MIFVFPLYLENYRKIHIGTGKDTKMLVSGQDKSTVTDRQEGQVKIATKDHW